LPVMTHKLNLFFISGGDVMQAGGACKGKLMRCKKSNGAKVAPCAAESLVGCSGYFCFLLVPIFAALRSLDADSTKNFIGIGLRDRWL